MRLLAGGIRRRCRRNAARALTLCDAAVTWTRDRSLHVIDHRSVMLPLNSARARKVCSRMSEALGGIGFAGLLPLARLVDSS
jgi:hypothetical protein